MSDSKFSFLTRDELVNHLIKDIAGTQHLLDYALAGDTLWMVAEALDKKTRALSISIVCYILSQNRKKWTGTRIKEQLFPDTCPLSFLDIAGFSDSHWRRNVRLYHEKKQLDMRPGDTVFFHEFSVPYVCVTRRIDIAFRCLFEGVFDGKTYVLTPSHLRLATDYRAA